MRPVVVRAWALLASLAAAVAGCASAPTQLIVVVDTNLAIPGELDEVQITVSSTTGVMAAEQQALASDAILPLTLALIASGDFLGPIDVTAHGLREGTVVVERRARVTLVRGETRALLLHLVRSCVGVSCAATESCGEAGCEGLDVAELPPWSGSPPRLGEHDAGRPDASFDAPPSDIGPVDAPDGGTTADDAFISPDGAMDPDAAVGVDASMDCATDGDCADGQACTLDTCIEGRCVHAPDDSLCDDGEQCTDDRCQATGCAYLPGTGACNDSIFCNGFDQCSGGSCSMHTGDPCGAPTVCDEGGDRCSGCLVAADCPADSVGSWGSCGWADGCAETSTRSRTARTYTCMAGACIPDDTIETEPCTRDTDGVGCGVGSCAAYGACSYTDSCDESAVATRTCTDLACAGGVCRSMARSETMPCTRSTTGMACGATSCPSFSACDYSDTCDEMAMQTRSCTDFECGAGACAGHPRVETMPCSRSTSGTACGTTSCGSYGACDYSSTCDQDAMRTRTCTDRTCGAGTCGMPTRMESAVCTRSTEGTSCGASLVCRSAACVSCAPTLSGAFGTSGSGYLKGVTGSGANLTFTDQVPTMGSISAPGVTFGTGGTMPLCIWQVIGMGSTLRFVDWDGSTIVNVSVAGATVSGTSAPPCVPAPPYGCFPPCLQRVTTSGSTLTLDYGAGTPTGTVTFGCP